MGKSVHIEATSLAQRFLQCLIRILTVGIIGSASFPLVEAQAAQPLAIYGTVNDSNAERGIWQSRTAEGQLLLLRAKPELTEHDLARVEFKDFGNHTPGVHLVFTASGTKRFQAFTRKYLGKQIALFVNGTLIVAPIVDAAATDSSTDISAVSENEARAMVATIAAAIH